MNEGIHTNKFTCIDYILHGELFRHTFVHENILHSNCLIESPSSWLPSRDSGGKLAAQGHMAAFFQPALRRCLRLRAYCISTGMVSLSHDAASSRSWLCSHVGGRLAPWTSIMANVRGMLSHDCPFDIKSLSTLQTLQICTLEGSAFLHARHLLLARCHHSFAHSRKLSYKLKPLSSWKRRFQITSTGKFLRKQKGKRHKSFSKSRKRRLRLRTPKLVHQASATHIKKTGFALR